MPARRGWAKAFSSTIAAAALAVGCSHASAGPGRGPPEAGPSDAASCGDDESCGPGDGEADAAVVDTGWVCPVVPASNVGATCDACIQAHCDAHWCACAEDTKTNDASTPECLVYLACLETCPADAGDAETCPSAGCDSGAYDQASEQDGQALFTCIAQSCGSACPGVVSLLL
jgi:hypothetical protein